MIKVDGNKLQMRGTDETLATDMYMIMSYARQMHPASYAAALHLIAKAEFRDYPMERKKEKEDEDAD